MESLLLYRYKFPSVLVVYQNITVCIYSIFVLIGYTAKEDLFCSSIDLTETFDDPTPFCTITGMYTSVTAITVIVGVGQSSIMIRLPAPSMHTVLIVKVYNLYLNQIIIFQILTIVGYYYVFIQVHLYNNMPCKFTLYMQEL